MEISIRQATAQELPTITSILDQAVSSKTFHGDLAWGDKAYDANSLGTAIARRSLFVALADGEVVATFRLEPTDEVHWGPQPPVAMYVQRFATAGGFRGQNLGSQIFGKIGDFVKTNKRYHIRLICPSKNAKLAAYHESNGFTRVDYKANPAHSSVSVVYYERLVDPTYLEPQPSQKKSGLLHRLRGRKT